MVTALPSASLVGAPGSARLQSQAAEPWNGAAGRHLRRFATCALLGMEGSLPDGNWRHPFCICTDTEMDAEVEPSIETEQRIREEEAASARRAQQLLAIRAEQEAEAAKERRRAEEAVLAAQTAAVNRAAELDAIRQVLVAMVPLGHQRFTFLGPVLRR